MEITMFGELLKPQAAETLFQAISSALRLRKRVGQFIGAHPSSLTRSTITDLLSEDYLVCEKSDGVRVILLVYNKVLYFYDRKNVFYRTRYAMNTSDMFLFDGELFKEGDSFIFAIFDTLLAYSVGLLAENLLTRLDGAFRFSKEIDRKPGLLQVSNEEKFRRFRITVKMMTKSYGFYQILDTIPQLKHANDGLIFTPINEPYMVAARTHTYKWKPPHLNTVDFLIRKSIFPYTYDLYALVAEKQLGIRKRQPGVREEDPQTLRKFDTFYVSDENLELDDKIGEFCYDAKMDFVDTRDYTIEKGGWSLYKIRTDKTTPNNLKVIYGIIESIKEEITEEMLRGYWKPIMENYKKRQVSKTDVPAGG